ncbi:MAG: amino acid adenylation domain-containing protein, partial [Burkholderiales bacterium]|nr:amino acid adenylation domain-containing protein [Burkholderiales bacterium]
MNRPTADTAPLSAAEKRRLLAELLGARPVPTAQRFALSFAQRRLWFIDRLQPGQIAYNIPAALRIEGRLQVERLERSLNAVVARHEILRATFHEADGEPAQSITASVTLPLHPEALDAAPAQRAAAIEQALRRLVAEPFDLARGPLLRCRLLRCGPDDHVLLLAVHHIVADYWSLRVLFREIAVLYAGDSAPLPPLPIQYVDYAAWQQQQSPRLQAQLDYWMRQLAAPPPTLPLPWDHPRPPVQRFTGAHRRFTLSAALTQRLRTIARDGNASLFATLLAAFHALLHRYTGHDDIQVGSTVSNRERRETRDLIGLFVNNLVLRARVTPDLPFDVLQQQVRTTTLEAFAHQDVPFEQVVDALRVERRLDRHALFQVMFVLHNTPETAIDLPGLRLSAVAADLPTTRFDLGLDMVEHADGLSGTFEFSTDLFEPATIERMITHFGALLHGVAADPHCPVGALPLLSPAEQRQAAPWNGNATPIPEGGALALIAEQVRRRPDAVAVVSGDESVDYRQLDARVHRLAAHLRQRGIGHGDRIGLCVPRSVDLVVGLLACLRLGAAYVPLDPRQPASRLCAMLQDAGAALALVRGNDLDASLPCATVDLLREPTAPAPPGEDIDAPVPPETPAYVMFTSGTTGRPKGVPISHRSLANLLAAMAHAPGMTAGDALLAVTTIAFDIATLELLLPLCVGARVVIADVDTASDGARLAAALDRHGITHLQATPATWQLLLDAGWRGRASLRMLCGGEALDRSLARRLLDRGAGLWNLYGPTETTIWSAALEVTADHLAGTGNGVPIGAAIANTTLCVLDDRLQPVPVGIAGELCIGGAGLSAGYRDRPDLTAAKFVDVVDGDGGTVRLYRTGDRVRRRTDGLFDFLGRIDHQIKLRGFRIEPGDIEAALATHPDVDRALVVVVLHATAEDVTDPTPPDPLLVAYYTRAGDAHVEPAALRDHLSRRLPAYMLPAAFMPLDRFPLTPNGKIDRRALPMPGRRPSNDAIPAGAPPSTPTEIRLAELWSGLLPQKVRDTGDDFFALGGHSLLAARMIARLRAGFGVDIPLRTVFEHPTLGAFATQVDRASLSRPAIVPVPRGDALLLSAAQQRQWVLAQLEPDSPFYNVPAAVRIDGELSLPLLERSLQRLCRRHEGLRSHFPVHDERPTLRIADAMPIAIASVDLGSTPADRRESRAAEILREHARQPFDLAHPPLLRVTVLHMAPTQHIVLVVLHHILADAWSMGILMHDLVRIYERLRAGDLSDLPALPLQYADYAAWQRTLDTTTQLEYWRTQLADAPVLLDLPTDYPRPAAQRFAGSSVRFRLKASEADALARLGKARGATLFMTLLTVFKLLLARYAGTADLVVGTPVGHRPQAELDDVIGLFTNTLALRTDLAGCTTFAMALDRVRATTLAAFAHQDVPFDQVVDALQVPRNWSHAPVFQVMFLWQPARVDAPLPDRRWQPVPVDTAVTKLDLGLALAEADDGIEGRLDFRTDLFRIGTIDCMAEAFCTLAQAIGRTPDAALTTLPIVHPRQRALLGGWNATRREHDRDACMHTAFEAQARATPDATALICDRHALSYRTLNGRANAVAQRLQALGIGPEQRVGVCVDRTSDLIVALLAVLKAGGAYVPLDPAYPAARLAFILEDARVGALLTQTRYRTIAERQPATTAVFLDTFIAPPDVADLAPTAVPANAAYVIYTSGSTGRPKGVTIEHRQAAALIHWARDTFSDDELSGVLAGTSICFDLSVFEIFVPLNHGGTVILADDVLQLPHLPASDRVTLINTVPTAAVELLRLGPLPPRVSVVNVAGEPVPPTLVRDLYVNASVARVWNLYGPSEDTTYSTGALLPRHWDGAIVPIGEPIANTEAHVLDDQFQPVAVGMPGELFLAGEGVTRGYWDRPDLTAERFVPNPFAGPDTPHPVLYRTGDRVRRRGDGVLEFLGRMDQQVKIRGFRIELGEIEAALRQAPAVAQAVVMPWTDARGHRRLAAYVVLDAGTPLADLPQRLRAHLQTRLPDFMLPAEYMPLAALPLLPNGKLDRGNLPAPTAESDDHSATEAAPRTPTEQQLTAIWRHVLGRDAVGIHDHFFELGGDSILAIQAIAQARQAGLPLSPRDLFQHPTIAALATVVGTGPAAMASPDPVVGPVPLSPMQHAFFEHALTHPAHWNQSIL